MSIVDVVNGLQQADEVVPAQARCLVDLQRVRIGRLRGTSRLNCHRWPDIAAEGRVTDSRRRGMVSTSDEHLVATAAAELEQSPLHRIISPDQKEVAATSVQILFAQCCMIHRRRERVAARCPPAF